MSKGTENKGFMNWYESYQGKKVVGAVYSLGASVVIVGALFKIMHFPGAGAMLMVGMGIVALDAGETYKVVVFLLEEGTYTLTISVEYPNVLSLGDNNIELVESELENGLEYTFYAEVAGQYTFASNDLGARVFTMDGTMVGMGVVALEADTDYKVVVFGMAEGTYTLNISVVESTTPSQGDVEGSSDNPIAMTIPSEIAVDYSGTGLVWYEVTLTETTTFKYTFTRNANWNENYWDTWVKITTATADLSQYWEKESSEITLEAGTYIIGFGTWSEDGTAQTLNVKLELVEADAPNGGGEVAPVRVWIGANASGRAMQITIDTEAGTISVIRAALAGNSLNTATGASETIYTYAFDGTNVTVAHVSGTQLTFTWNADGTVNTVVWGTAPYSGWELQ